MFRILYLVYRGAANLERRLRRRFTPAGLGVLLGLAVSTMVGLDTDNNLGYQATAILFFILAIAVGFTLFFRGRFAADRHLPRFGTVDTPLTYNVMVRNLTPKPQSGLFLLENLADSPPSYKEWSTLQQHEKRRFRSFRLGQTHRTNPFRPLPVKPALVPHLAANRPTEVRVELTPVRRGLLRFEGLTLARPDPFGLCRAFSGVSLPQSILILPRRYALPPVALPGTMKYQQGGIAQASHVGQSEEFVALRDYRHGDPLRHIHWRSWARVGRPVVKEFEDEFFVRHALVLDTFTDHGPTEVFEEAVSVAASFACTVQTQESLLDLLFVGAETYAITAGRGLAHADQLLEVLACVRPSSSNPFSVLEGLVLTHTGNVSGFIFVLLRWDSPRQELVRKLRMHGLPVVVLVLLPAEPRVRLDPGPLADEPQRFHVIYAGDVERGLMNLK